MDQELLKLLTRIKIQGKKLMGVEIDIIRLSADRAYAAEVLKRLSTSENEELVMTAIEFMGKLGLINAQTIQSELQAEAAGGDPVSDKYTGRLR